MPERTTSRWFVVFAWATFLAFVLGAIAFIWWGVFLHRRLDDQVGALEVELRDALATVDTTLVHERSSSVLGGEEPMSARQFGLPNVSEGSLVDVDSRGTNEFRALYRANSRRDQCVIASVRGPAPNDITVDEAHC